MSGPAFLAPAVGAVLGGALGYLGARVSPRWLPQPPPAWAQWALAAGTGLTAALLARAYPLTASFWHQLPFVALLLLAAFVDLQDRIIPNELVLSGLGAWLLVMLLAPYGDKSWLSALGGGAAAFAFFYLLAVLVPGGMGMGDVKLALVMGLFLGLNWVAMALFFAFVSGGLTAGVLLALRKVGRRGHIPFGPFMALGGLITLLWGNQIWTWYAG
ncbi:leader peptidase (prepilin peptidase)/N-methyltransferase [Symbiobacterium terraclitae]|uniref:Leader peptidase (Prepilin peptidase)/N-methyltransferase n=1 Tax=Symbiobacterium terraclitae TaxID=557451 RepID=A0ABS4JSD1_9FIRM|nr:A24 family peptidase [Symbiobacterium terraclitae]MBP2018449.1 leader peptidase (prepilin peptidase)/N-methyltransferase [Symbiobacterium terraclitae]